MQGDTLVTPADSLQKNELDVPLFYELGIAVKPTPRLTLAFDFAARPWSKAELSSNGAAAATNLLDDPDVNGIVFHGRDLTDRLEQQRRFRMFFEQSPVPAAVFQADHTMVANSQTNSPARTMSGTPASRSRRAMSARAPASKGSYLVLYAISTLVAALVLVSSPGGAACADEVETVRPEATPARPAAELRSIVSGGVRREFRIFVPATARSGLRPPVVMLLHGALGDSAQVERWTGLATVAEREGFVAVYPQGLDGAWNDGRPPELRFRAARGATVFSNHIRWSSACRR